MALENRFLGEFAGVDAAWRGMIRAISTAGNNVQGSVDPRSVGSTFGRHPRGYRELIGTSLLIRDPQNRLIRSEVRRIRPAYLLANVLWAALGSDELAWIEFYNPLGREFSDDQATLPAAIGKRIFRSSHGDQFAACAQLLARDPATRRAVLSIFTPDDVGSLHRDCSCVLSMQFLRRDLDLHCIVCMRSQSAVMVFPYDAFVLTMLHESMAVQIGACPGNLVLQYGSLHYYDDEAELAADVLHESLPSPGIMPPMRASLAEAAATLGGAEQEIRRTGCYSARSSLDSYWNIYLFALRHALESDRTAAAPRTVPEQLRSSWYASIL